MRWFKRKSIIAWLVLIVLGLRSLIPVGYMPDFSGHGTLVMCDGTDHMHTAHGGHMGGHNGHADVCPFSAGAIFGFAGIKAPVIAPPVYAAEAAVLPAALPLVRDAEFGNASPRSPPFFS